MFSCTSYAHTIHTFVIDFIVSKNDHVIPLQHTCDMAKKNFKKEMKYEYEFFDDVNEKVKNNVR